MEMAGPTLTSSEATDFAQEEPSDDESALAALITTAASQAQMRGGPDASGEAIACGVVAAMRYERYVRLKERDKDNDDPTVAAWRLLTGFAEALVEKRIATREASDVYQTMLALVASPVDLPKLGASAAFVRGSFTDAEDTISNIIGTAAGYAKDHADDETDALVVKYGVVVAMRYQQYLSLDSAAE